MGASKSQTVIWAVLLFFGFDILGWFISWLLPELFGVTWNRGTARPWEVPNVFLASPFALLVASYFFVRRLDHHMLSHLWLFAIIFGAIGIIAASATVSFDSLSTLGWWVAAFTLVGYIVLGPVHTT